MTFVNRRWRLLLGGVLLPLLAIAFELETEACYANFFDPLPTRWHVLLVLTVPAFHLGRIGKPWSPWLDFWGGFALMISAVYALVFLPIMPVSVMLIFLAGGLGILGFAPIVAWATTLAALRRRGFNKITRYGLMAGLLGLVLGSVPLSLTDMWMAEGDVAELRCWGLRHHMLGYCLQHYHAALYFSPAVRLQPLEAEGLFERVWGTAAKVESPPPVLGYSQYIRGGGRLFHPLDAQATPEPDQMVLLFVAVSLLWKSRKR